MYIGSMSAEDLDNGPVPELAVRGAPTFDVRAFAERRKAAARAAYRRIILAIAADPSKLSAHGTELMEVIEGLGVSPARVEADITALQQVVRLREDLKRTRDELSKVTALEVIEEKRAAIEAKRAALVAPLDAELGELAEAAEATERIVEVERLSAASLQAAESTLGLAAEWRGGGW